MMSVSTGALLGELQVVTTTNRGRSPEELTDEAVNKILYVSSNVHPVIRDQAVAFKEQIRGVMLHYMKQAVVSDRTTLANKFKASGHADLVKLLEN
jgi:hypothetical protein